MPGNFDAKVAGQMEQLRRSAYREIEDEIAQKRSAWLAQNQPAAGKQVRFSPRQAFEELFLPQIIQQRLKHAFDPHGVFNRGRLFPDLANLSVGFYRRQ